MSYQASWNVVDQNNNELEVKILRWRLSPGSASEDVTVELYETEPMASQTPSDSLAEYSGRILRRSSGNPRLVFERDSSDIPSAGERERRTGDVFRFRFQGESEFDEISVSKDASEPHEVIYDIGLRIRAGEERRFPAKDNAHATCPVKKKAPVLVCKNAAGRTDSLATIVEYIQNFAGTGRKTIEAQLSQRGQLTYYDGRGRRQVTSGLDVAVYPVWANGNPNPTDPDWNEDDFESLSLEYGTVGSNLEVSRKYIVETGENAASEPMGTVIREAEALVSNAQNAQRWSPAGNIQNPAPELLQIDEPGALSIEHEEHTLFFRPRFGYNGSNKCNIFALDIAWRSGMKTPVFRKEKMPHDHDGDCPEDQEHKILSYPLANHLTRLAEEAKKNRKRLLDVYDNEYGEVVSDWSSPASREFEINRRISQGEAMFLAARNVNDNNSGHVGVIGGIHRILMGDSSNETGYAGIIGIDYVGWEATAAGARRVHRKWLCGQNLSGQTVSVPAILRPYWTSNTTGNNTTGGSDVHNGPFKDIHIIKLNPSEQTNEAVLVKSPWDL